MQRVVFGSNSMKACAIAAAARTNPEALSKTKPLFFF